LGVLGVVSLRLLSESAGSGVVSRAWSLANGFGDGVVSLLMSVPYVALAVAVVFGPLFVTSRLLRRGNRSFVFCAWRLAVEAGRGQAKPSILEKELRAIESGARWQLNGLRGLTAIAVLALLILAGAELQNQLGGVDRALSPVASPAEDGAARSPGEPGWVAERLLLASIGTKRESLLH
jgi:hypothetical protein